MVKMKSEILKKSKESEHILNRDYNSTKPFNWPIDNATTAHFTWHMYFKIYNCINCDQGHTKICPAKNNS